MRWAAPAGALGTLLLVVTGFPMGFFMGSTLNSFDEPFRVDLFMAIFIAVPFVWVLLWATRLWFSIRRVSQGAARLESRAFAKNLDVAALMLGAILFALGLRVLFWLEEIGFG